jgi:hypothetical protein
LCRVVAGAAILASMSISSLQAQSAELWAKYPLRDRIAYAWATNEFGELERLAAAFRAGELGNDGAWKLKHFYNFFEEAFDTHSRADYNFDLETMDFTDRLRAWEAKIPDSHTTPILRAIMLYRHSTNPSVVSAQKHNSGWALSKQLRGTAKGILEAQTHLSARDPHYYVLMANLFCRDNASDEALILLSDEALQRFPGYLPIYDVVLSCFLPRWSHNHQRVNSYVNMISGPRTAQESDLRYALIYLSAYESYYTERLFTASGVDWVRMKAGLTVQQERFPTADVINQIAKLSCLAGDRAHTRAQMKLINDKPVRVVWVDMKIYESCSDWAG